MIDGQALHADGGCEGKVSLCLSSVTHLGEDDDEKKQRWMGRALREGWVDNSSKWFCVYIFRILTMFSWNSASHTVHVTVLFGVGKVEY